MRTRMLLRITVDVGMTILLVVLMGHMLTGDLVHEISGTALFILWIIHALLNRRWYGNLTKGTYTPLRIINLTINMLLLICGLSIMYSAVILSSQVFRFLGIERGMSSARIIHMVSVYWYLLLSSLHLGLHWNTILYVLENRNKIQSYPLRVILRAIPIVFSIAGVYSFIEQQLASYMFARTQFVFFDFEQSAISFFTQYVSMIVFFATAAYYGKLLISFIRRRRRSVYDTQTR